MKVDQLLEEQTQHMKIQKVKARAPRRLASSLTPSRENMRGMRMQINRKLLLNRSRPNVKVVIAPSSKRTPARDSHRRSRLPYAPRAPRV